MIIAYFDATYNHYKESKPLPVIHTVAAYIGTSDNWRKFRNEWRTELSKKQLDHFHMTHFEFAVSQVKAGRPIPHKNLFHNWNPEDLLPFLKRLHRTIARKSDGIYRLYSNASSVIKSDFDEVLPNELKLNPKCRSCFIFNIWIVMQGIIAWADRNNYHGMPIHYIFSDGDGENGNIQRLFASFWESDIDKHYFHLTKERNSLGFEMESMKAEPALQAADISAYECNKIALKWAEKNFTETPELRKSMLSLGQSEHFGWVYRKKEIIETFADILRYEQIRKDRGLK